LVTQHIGNAIHSVALSTHAEHLHGDEFTWLKIHAEAICWDGCDDLVAAIARWSPE
jgi:hypothetical protein